MTSVDGVAQTLQVQPESSVWVRHRGGGTRRCHELHRTTIKKWVLTAADDFMS